MVEAVEVAHLIIRQEKVEDLVDLMLEVVKVVLILLKDRQLERQELEQVEVDVLDLLRQLDQWK